MGLQIFVECFKCSYLTHKKYTDAVWKWQDEDNKITKTKM